MAVQAAPAADPLVYYDLGMVYPTLPSVLLGKTLRDRGVRVVPTFRSRGASSLQVAACGLVALLLLGAGGRR